MTWYTFSEIRSRVLDRHLGEPRIWSRAGLGVPEVAKTWIPVCAGMTMKSIPPSGERDRTREIEY